LEQAPQLLGSEAKSTQYPPQLARPAAQASMQAPASHTPLAQTTPHAPQLFASEYTFAQSRLPVQSTQPSGQAVGTHSPPMQATGAGLALGHWCMHEPQCR
jgi:hypothetical protein